MKTITLSFTEPELKDLAKLLVLGSIVAAGDYFEIKDVDRIFIDRVCKAGMEAGNATGCFKHVKQNDFEYFITEGYEDEMLTMIEDFEEWALEENLCWGLASRDFEESYGPFTDDPQEDFNTDAKIDTYQAMHKKYLDEFTKYGVRHLRLEEDLEG